MKKTVLAIAILLGLAGSVSSVSARDYVLCENWSTKQVIVLPSGSYCPSGWREIY